MLTPGARRPRSVRAPGHGPSPNRAGKVVIGWVGSKSGSARVPPGQPSARPARSPADSRTGPGPSTGRCGRGGCRDDGGGSGAVEYAVVTGRHGPKFDTGAFGLISLVPSSVRNAHALGVCAPNAGCVCMHVQVINRSLISTSKSQRISLVRT